METTYEILKPSIPADHCRQAQATDLLNARVAGGFAPSQVLDLGCGAGNTIDFFRRRLPDASWVGVDIAESPEVAQRSRGDATFVTFDGVNLPFDDDEFDLIYSNQVLEHVRYPEPLLAEVSRVLAPGGLFIGQTSHLEPYHSFSFWNFTIYGFKTICEAAGLDLDEVRPGIDGITLTKRAYLGRPPEYSQWFADESPINEEIESAATEQNRSPQIINYRKLMFCGQFAFVCKHPGAMSEAPPFPDEPQPEPGTPEARRARRARRARQARRAQRADTSGTPPTPPAINRLALPGGLSIEYQCPHNFHIPRALSGTGLAGYEPATLAAYLACIESSVGVVYDVGANIGLYALAAASAFRRQTIAFEPFPAAGDVLEDIRNRYDLPITLRRSAMADEPGTTTFYLSARSDMSNSLNPGFRQHSGELKVETTTLDLEAKRWPPGVIKIDTETTEMDVLRGGRDVFSTFRPSVIVEILGQEIAEQARSFFAEFDYTILDLGAADIWQTITGLSQDVTPGDQRNWVVLPGEVNKQFLERAAHWAKVIQSLPILNQPPAD